VVKKASSKIKIGVVGSELYKDKKIIGRLTGEEGSSGGIG